MRRFEPVKIREALRLREMSLSNVNISRSIQCSRTTLIEMFRKCDEVEMTHAKASTMSDSELDRLLYPQAHLTHIKIADPDFAAIQSELLQHPNLNLKFLWDEYAKRTEGALSYSQFCERYKRWRKDSGKELTMPIVHKPGETMEVDWAGDAPLLFCDKKTGELKPIYLFVASVGYSGRLYAEAFPSMNSGNWISAHTHAFEHYAARPRIVTPDNTKTAVLKHIRYDPLLNPLYAEWAEFYEVAIIPARPRKPRDKASVEGGVGWLETWLLGRLRNRRFFSFPDLNRAIRDIMAELDEEPYQKRPGSRLSTFLEVDLPAMRPLPATRFEKADFKVVTVGNNYHVEYDQVNYSVPHTYFHKKVTVRATGTTIEVLYDNMRICSHVRCHDLRQRYVTTPEHMPEKHRQQAERNSWDGARYRSWAKNVGLNTYAVTDAMLKSKAIEEQMYKSCMGLLQLSRKYGNERLESACHRARSMGANSYTVVSNILKHGQDMFPLDIDAEQIVLPMHENVRGSSYYK